MSKTLGEWMTLVIVINIIFTPILAYIDSLQREAVEVVLNEGAKKAAIEGYFTPGIIDEMKNTLVNDYGFNEATIDIQATMIQMPRNEYIEASIEVPRGFIFVLKIFNPGPASFKKDIQVMSEYVN